MAELPGSNGYKKQHKVQYTSSIPKGSILLNVFDCDLDDGTECKFSDNTKLEGVYDTLDSCTAIWKNPDRLEKWADSP